MATTTALRRAPAADPHASLSDLESRLIQGTATPRELGNVIDALRAVVDGADPSEFVARLTGSI